MAKDQRWGFPKSLGIYELGEPKKIGGHYQVPVIPLREVDLQIPRTLFGPKAETEQGAYNEAIRHFQLLAHQMDLEFLLQDGLTPTH